MENIICQWLCIFAALFRTDCLQVATEDVTPDTLCVFDIDMVLIQPANPAFQIPNMQKYESSRYTDQLTPKQVGELVNTVSLERSTLVEANAPCIVRRLTNRHVRLLGLTNTFTKAPYEETKIEHLKKLGISFEPILDRDLVFTNLPKMHGSFPTYRAGILFTNDVSKAQVLVDFLHSSHLCFKKVVMIDDFQHNLKEAQSALQQYDSSIEFTGYLYTGAEKYPSEEISKEEFDRTWQKVIDKID